MTADELQRILDAKTKPVGSLGRLEAIAVRAGASPSLLRASLTIFVADHGIAGEGVSAFPQEVTGQMVANFLAGGAAANVIAAALGIPVTIVDCGVRQPPAKADKLVDLRRGPGTANSAREPAMSRDDAERAIEAGRAYGAAVDCQIACFGEMGIANTSAATLLAHELSGLPVEKLVGRGTGLDDSRLKRKLAVLGQAAGRTGALSPIDALAEVGGFEIGTMAGAMIGAAGAGRLVLVDGFIATAAAALARAIEPGCAQAMLHAHRSAEHGHGALLEWLGEGIGALLAVPIVRAARSLFGMASFAEAGVSGETTPQR